MRRNLVIGAVLALAFLCVGLVVSQRDVEAREGGGGGAGPAGGANPRDGAVVAFTYMIEISGRQAFYATGVENLGSESEVVEHKIMGPGSKEPIIRKIPGRLKFTDIIVTTGATSSTDLWAWRQLIVDGAVDKVRASVTITMLDQSGKQVQRWTLKQAWPSKLVFTSGAAGAPGTLSMTIVSEGVVTEGVPAKSGSGNL